VRSNFHRHIVTCLVMICVPCVCSSQQPTQQHRQPTETEIRAAAERYRSPTDADLAKVPNLSSPKLDVDATPINLEALADKYKSITTPDIKALGLAATLYVFVSLDMPKASLANIIKQAENVGATLVLRGLKDRSIRKTAEAVQPLIGHHNVSWVIDPQPFTRFNVTAVPAYVLTRSSGTSSCDAGSYQSSCKAIAPHVKVTGDVTIDYVLDLVRSNSPQFRGDAELLLRKIRR
jgi:conjugal transfer pilus assembly protein TrbC